MEQKDFQAYFASDYKGIDSLLNDILLPVFGNDFDKGYDILTDDPDIKGKASCANIESIRHAGDIHSLGFDIKVYDVTICDNCKIERSRQGIQSLIRQYIGRFESAFMVFHYLNPAGRSWRLSYVEKLATAKESTSAKRYTYICGNGSPCRTIAERLYNLQFSDKGAKALLDAFSVESLSDEFFAKYKAIYANFVQYITGKRVVKVDRAWKEVPQHNPNDVLYNAFDQDDKRIRDYIKKTMGRVTFLYFLQRKGWLNGAPCFMQKLFADSKYQDDFLDRVLEPLFYTILNTDTPDRKNAFLKHNKGINSTKEVEWDIDLLDDWKNIPFLNGGLFERDENDIVRTQFPMEFFHNTKSVDNYINSIPGKDYDWEKVPGLLDFFDQYNFTIDENDPDDAEIGVDPEMLGKIFENLLEDNKDKGAFYTPKEIVQYMCRESLIAYLQTDAADDGTKQQLRLFVENPFESTLSAELAKSTLEKIQNVKICDPAIGSGAFPMGLLNLLVACTESLNAICGVKQERIDTKKHIIQNSIYGVDIERGAIDIARLRFWLSIVVDSTGPEPLPNFDYKFMQGNSLLEQFEGVDLSNLMSDADSGSSQLALSFGEADTKKNIKALMNSYFNEKDHTRKAQLRDQIDMQVKEHVRLLTEGRADIAQHLQDIPVSANQHFFLWHTWFSDVFNRTDDCNGFDIVIGNPPYVDVKTLPKEDVKNYFRLFHTTENRINLYSIFIERCYSLIKENGILTFINPNSILINESYTKIRKFIFDSVSQIIKLPDGVFKNATVETIILMLNKSNPEFVKATLFNNDDTLDFMDIKFNHVDKLLWKNDINCRFNIFSDSIILKLINKIELNNVKLNDLILSSLGITPYDKARGQTEEIIKNRKFHATSKLDENYVPLISGKNIHKYYISEEIDEYLKYGPWLGAPREKRFFTSPKIIVRQILGEHQSIISSYDENDRYFTQIGFSLISKNDSPEELKYITAILNSKLMTFYHMNKFLDKEKTVFQKILIANIKQFPIPNSTKEQQQEIIFLVDKISEAKKQNTSVDTSSLEKEIDSLVYKLYNLSKEEIDVIEGN